MKLWHAVWFWQTIHCEAIQINTDKFQEWNFPKYQAIMSGG